MFYFNNVAVLALLTIIFQLFGIERYLHRQGIGYFVASMVAQVVLGVLASMIAMWFSRRREFRADAGSAHLVGKNKMIAALQRLQVAHEPGHHHNNSPPLASTTVWLDYSVRIPCWQIVLLPCNAYKY